VAVRSSRRGRPCGRFLLVSTISMCRYRIGSHERVPEATISTTISSSFMSGTVSTSSSFHPALPSGPWLTTALPENV